MPCRPFCPSGHLIPGAPGGPGNPFGPKQEQIKQRFNCTEMSQIGTEKKKKKNDFEMSVLVVFWGMSTLWK